MQTVVFAPETCNLAETSRMLVIARACEDRFVPLFTSYGGDFTYLVEEAGYPMRKLTPRMTPEKIEHLYKADQMETMADPFTAEELTERVQNEIALFEEVKPAAVVMGFTLSMLISARVAGIPLIVVGPLAGTRLFYEAGLGTWPDAFDYSILRWIPERFLNKMMTWWVLHTRPIIYFAMGSSGKREIIKEIVQGFGEKPYRVIAPVKARLEGMEVTVPDNVLVTGWLPAHKVNPMADISVIHGGQGTVQTACLAGTPIVGVGMQPEQEANLDFLVRRGMAIRIRKRRVTAQAIT